MRANRRLTPIGWIAAVVVSTSCGPAPDSASPNASVLPTEVSSHRDDAGHGGGAKEATTLYIWASDQARVAPDFLAVIDFDRRSPDYGKVLKTVPLPPPGNVGNEPHHCHASADQTILACGALLSVLKGQNDIFFFDISDARNPKFLKSTHAPSSSITDDFLPMPGGGFLVTNMGSASGGAGGRVVEFDKDLNLVAEHPSVLPADGGFNPHGIDADFSRNRLVTSDFINPVTTLNVFAGDLQLRSSIRFWDLGRRTITRSVFLPDNAGTMDVKLIPGDNRGRAITVNMFTGRMYTVDPTDGSYVQSFDMADVTPHVDTPVPGGMPGLLAMPRRGRTVITATLMAGQVVMLDITNPKKFKQLSVVSFGKDTGPHSVHLTHDDKRLVVTDYFLNQDGFGKVHLEVAVLDADQAAPAPAPSPRADERACLTVLVVAAEADLRRYVRECLRERPDLRLVEAATVMAAVRLASECSPALLIVDEPERAVLAVLSRLRAITIVDDVPRDAAASGTHVRLLARPFTAAQLAAGVDQLLSGAVRPSRG